MNPIILKKTASQYAQRPLVTRLILRVRALLKTRWLFKKYRIPCNPVSYRKLECKLKKDTVAISIEARGGVTINNKVQRCGRRSTNFRRHFYDFGELFSPIYSSNLLRLAATKRLGGLPKANPNINNMFVNIRVSLALTYLASLETEHVQKLKHHTRIHTYFSLESTGKEPRLFMDDLPTVNEIRTHYNNYINEYLRTPGKPLMLTLDKTTGCHNRLTWKKYTGHFTFIEE